MKIAVTTSYSVLCVDLLTGISTPLHREDGLYYGLACNHSEIMVGARSRMVSSDQSSDQEKGAVLVFDKEFRFKSRLQPSNFTLRDIHDIGWNDGRLWVTCSYDNMIAIWDGECWEQWYPLGEPDSEPWDRNHFNTFYFEEDCIWLVAHNKGASEMLKFNRSSRELESRLFLGQQAHNLWRENGVLYTCSSGEGAVIGSNGFRLETGGFPRGVAFGGGLRCVGISELVERKARDLTTPRIAIFNASWERVSEVVLPNEGLILDLKLLDELIFREKP